jgi:RHS repeat-associated protein
MVLQITGNNMHGSPQLVVSGGSNNTFAWSPFGGGIVRAGAATSLPGFNGERQDPLSGVSHLGNGYRAYSPTLRRFTCPDSESPFGVGGINPYTYCDNDPINTIDPSGHAPKWLSTLAKLDKSTGVKDEQARAMSSATVEVSMQDPGVASCARTISGIPDATRLLRIVPAAPVQGRAVSSGEQQSIHFLRCPRTVGVAAYYAAMTSTIKLTELHKSDLNQLLEEHKQRSPVCSDTASYQTPAPEELIYSLELSTNDRGLYKMKNLATRELHDPGGAYLFTNRVDEPGIIRVARYGMVFGHTPLTQNPLMNGYFPVGTYYAGMLYCDNGELKKRTDASEHYRPAKNIHSTNLIPWVRR